MVAIRPAASTVEPLPKKTPLGLIRMIRPLAEIAPNISDGAMPTTLFAVTDDADGWLKRTLSPFATEKLFHSMNARSEDWSIVTRDVPWPDTVAAPPVTLAPVGLAKEPTGFSTAATRSVASGRSRRLTEEAGAMTVFKV